MAFGDSLMRMTPRRAKGKWPLLHNSGQGAKPGNENVGRRIMEDWRISGVDYGDFRSGNEYDVLDDRKSFAFESGESGARGDNLYADSLLALDPDTGKIEVVFPIYAAR